MATCASGTRFSATRESTWQALPHRVPVLAQSTVTINHISVFLSQLLPMTPGTRCMLAQNTQ